jgi:transcriptional regulator with XRE-family HTH domain
MIAASDAVLQRRRLLRRLRQARMVWGQSQAEVAQALEWSESKVLRIELGKSSVSKTDLMAMLQLYGVTDSQKVTEFVEMARRSRQKSWTSEYQDVAAKPFLDYIDFEEQAGQLRSYEPILVPGLLQTMQYARAAIDLHSPPGSDARTVERRVELRMRRQDLLQRRDRPELTFIVEEGALRRQVGVRTDGPQVMQDQLRRILTLTNRPGITLQVLPFAAGEHRGMVLGSFVHLRFPDPADRDLVFRESAAGDATDHVPVEQAWPYEKTFVQLQELALDPDASRAMIHAMLREIHGHDP